MPMKIAVERYFKVMLYLMVLSGFGTLARTGQLDPITVLLVVAALVVRGYLLAARKRFLLAERWTQYLTLAFAFWYFADLFWISGTFVAATVHLVLALLVLRLFSAHRDRDFVFLAILSFLLVLAASVLTVDSAFLIGFGLFLLTAVATFILLDMRRSASAATAIAIDSIDSKASQKMGKALSALTPVLVLIILSVAVLIFFLLPRISAGYLSAYAPTTELSTGFSDRVELGRIGQVQQSNSVVMHVEVSGDESGKYSELLWRGIALNEFDGRSWSNTERQVIVPRSVDGRFVIPSSNRSTSSQHSIHYRVLLEPLGTNVFFVAPRVESLEGGYRVITTDEGGALYDLDREHPVSAYEADSDISQPSARDSSNLSPDPTPIYLKKYLQRQEVDPRISELSQQITANSPGAYESATRIEQYLRSHYGYTLELGNVVPKDPIVYFLFERKRGHCEYFASSMAVMLRTLGIPSRVVNGFRGGEFNDITSQYLVRMRDAHSWVEAFLPGYGWISFDPTPAVDAGMNNHLSRFMLYLDAASSFWREWVINYDFHHQKVLGGQASHSSRRAFEQMREWGRRKYAELLSWAHRIRHRMLLSPRSWIAGSISFLLLLVVVMNMRLIWAAVRTRLIANHPERSPQQAASIWYERMTRAVARKGWRKLPEQTPGEFLITIKDPQLQQLVAAFTDRYRQARFAESADDARQLPELYQEVASKKK